MVGHQISLLTVLMFALVEGAPLELKKGDHICYLGNTLAERMQHFGWIETYIQSRFPNHELRFRNLGFSGDELTKRLRSAGFGSPADHLKLQQTDVIFAFFGYNESFAGQLGLGKFRADLTNFIRQTLGQKYNGESAPRLVIFSPIAHENLNDPSLPDGKENNRRLAVYTDAMASVAEANNVTFVDFYQHTLANYESSKTPFTFNGIHLSEYGNERLASITDRMLFPSAKLKRDPARLEKIQKAVLEKNHIWYNRYRTVDGYSIFGGRSRLRFVKGQTNRDVMQREMAILDVMADNRDKPIWAAAQGRDLKVNDNNTPEFVKVVSNRKGKNPDGSYKFLSGEEAISQMTVAKGMKVKLFADEKMFPELINPVQMAFDTKGRLWVAAWRTYPHWKPKQPMDDKLLIFEDTNGDGKADKMKVFADDLHCPTGFEFWNGGVYVGQIPDLVFLKDTDGDDKADVRLRVLHGIDSADTHHSINSFVFSPGGALFFQEGIFHRNQIETPWRAPERVDNGGVYRYEPRTHKFECFISHAFPNPHGHVFDYWGQNFVTDGTGNKNLYAAAMSSWLDYPAKHGRPRTWLKNRFRPCPGTEILSSRHFPTENMDNMLVANCIGFLGIFQFKVHEEESGFRGEEVESILYSKDTNFRPVDLETGPDGSLYLVDWQNPLIGHMQHNLRDPNRDHSHGRIYRVIYEGRPLVKPVKIAGEPISRLLDLLKERENRVRYRTRIELSGRNGKEVIPAAQKWLAGLDKKEPDYEHHMMEGLWLHQSFDVVNEQLLKRMLRSPDYHARAAATRVFCYWRDRVEEPLGLLRVQTEDEHPRVRLEALRACSFFRDAEAAEIALLIRKHPMDHYLNFTFGEVMKQLDKFLKAAVAAGKFETDNAAAVEYVIGRASVQELLRLPRNKTTYSAFLTRPGVPEKNRREALLELSKMNKTDEMTELLKVIAVLDSGNISSSGQTLGELGSLLGAMPMAVLKKNQEDLKALVARSKSSEARAMGYIAWIRGDDSPLAAWEAASKSLNGLSDFMGVIEMIQDDHLKSTFYPILRPLMFKLPPHLSQGEAENEADALGRPGINLEYFQKFPRNARKESFKLMKPDTKGITKDISFKSALIKNKSSFSLRFTGSIQIPQSGRYTFYTNSDDGSMLYIDGKAVVNNDGRHGNLEKSGKVNLTAGPHEIIVTFFDSGGGDHLIASWQGPGIRKQNIPAKVLRTEGGMSLRDEIILTVSALPGHEAEKFKDFASLIQSGKNFIAATKALAGIPQDKWPVDGIKPVIDGIADYVAKKKPSQRTTPEIVAALKLGNRLAFALPDEESAKARAELHKLSVQKIVIKPVPHEMIYNRKQMTIEAGRPVEITFENIDVMPHNLVITAKDAMIEVGEAAEAMQGPEGMEKHYIPESPKVLWATKLLLPGEVEKLFFIAPKETGKYPYICTFPGHYLIMNGTMVVVDSFEGRTEDKVQVAGKGSNGRTFVKMWQMKDLVPSLKDGLAKGRSYNRGREMLNATGCLKCHSFLSQGSKLGPGLTEVTKKYQGEALLQQILEPSSEINEQFRSFAFILKDEDEDPVMGTVVKDDGVNLHVAQSLVNAEDVIKIKKTSIKEKKALPISPMPTGLLVTLTKEEILDLLAYIQSNGDPKDKAFGK